MLVILTKIMCDLQAVGCIALNLRDDSVQQTEAFAEPYFNSSSSALSFINHFRSEACLV